MTGVQTCALPICFLVTIFRGVQFGNWVKQQERQQSLNEAFDALHDLASILNIPTKAISLGGELGLAFGAGVVVRRWHTLNVAKW